MFLFSKVHSNLEAQNFLLREIKIQRLLPPQEVVVAELVFAESEVPLHRLLD